MPRRIGGSRQDALGVVRMVAVRRLIQSPLQSRDEPRIFGSQLLVVTLRGGSEIEERVSDGIERVIVGLATSHLFRRFCEGFPRNSLPALRGEKVSYRAYEPLWENPDGPPAA